MMTIFAIMMPSAQPGLANAIQTAFPRDHFMINEQQWLISAPGTVVEICATLGIYDAKEPNKVPVGAAVVFATTSYFGRAPTPIWDWLKAKLESRSG